MSEIQLDHIAIATHRLTDAPPFLVGVLGGIPFFGMEAGPFRFGQWEFEGDGRVEVVLEPRGTNGFLHRFLATRGPGIHHVTFKVPSLRQTCDRAAALGYASVSPFMRSFRRWTGTTPGKWRSGAERRLPEEQALAG